MFDDGTADVQPIDAFDRVACLVPRSRIGTSATESTLTVAQVVLTGFDDSDVPLAPATAAQSGGSTRCRQVGLRGLAARCLLTLSYGQRRRALLARALVRPTDVLLLDEALNGLDANGRKAFLRAATLSPGAAWQILTSHRRADARRAVPTHFATLAHGRLERAAPINAFGDPEIVAVEGNQTKLTRPGIATARRAVAAAPRRRGDLSRGTRGDRAVRLDPGGRRRALARARREQLGQVHAGRACLRRPLASARRQAQAPLARREDWKRRVGLLSPDCRRATRRPAAPCATSSRRVTTASGSTTSSRQRKRVACHGNCHGGGCCEFGRAKSA